MADTRPCHPRPSHQGRSRHPHCPRPSRGDGAATVQGRPHGHDASPLGGDPGLGRRADRRHRPDPDAERLDAAGHSDVARPRRQQRPGRSLPHGHPGQPPDLLAGDHRLRHRTVGPVGPPTARTLRGVPGAGAVLRVARRVPVGVRSPVGHAGDDGAARASGAIPRARDGDVVRRRLQDPLPVQRRTVARPRADGAAPRGDRRPHRHRLPAAAASAGRAARPARSPRPTRTSDRRSSATARRSSASTPTASTSSSTAPASSTPCSPSCCSPRASPATSSPNSSPPRRARNKRRSPSPCASTGQRSTS